MLNRESYEKSRIDWLTIIELAKRVASETRVPRTTREAWVDEARDRVINYGFMNLKKRTETYYIRNKIFIANDYWILESRYWTKRRIIRRNPDQENQEITRYCLRLSGELFCSVEHTEWVYDENSGERYSAGEKSCFEYNMNDEIVMKLDYEPNAYYARHGETIVNCNEIEKFNPPKSLLFNKKGEGLTSRLQKLLE